MSRMEDMPPRMARALREDYDLKAFDFSPWTPAPPARERRVALVSTGAFYRHGDRPFRFSGYDWRAIPSDARDLTMNHTSISLERTGFLQDINVAFPLDRIEEAAADGAIDSVASTHYSFNGGSASVGVAGYERYAVEVAGKLKEDGVNTVLFCPI